jgi:hypothetical protein
VLRRLDVHGDFRDEANDQFRFLSAPPCSNFSLIGCMTLGS